jgi:hypothetical protein
MAQAARLLVTLAAMGLAAWLWFALTGWLAWTAAAGAFLIGGGIAEIIFRRLASAEVLRADLEDRVRNPPP